MGSQPALASLSELLCVTVSVLSSQYYVFSESRRIREWMHPRVNAVSKSNLPKPWFKYFGRSSSPIGVAHECHMEQA
ncbi:uncharacterized protein F5891DRAFT_747746 [Suillus fuscotomentosus]|uniref:Secreted protein n=1 Tax=Suillus fuscotomentosus TaxID=1912939 RepID=A0AAD4HQ70_9AGAM|nr:uncharacterized protein F5891DRAFT_747746 [Suillus fuscotomentosus]KAG1904541.1 hypothetical protein F5891DRAFT_747746 [Suillus fuscotomentosus]